VRGSANAVFELDDRVRFGFRFRFRFRFRVGNPAASSAGEP